MKGSRRRFLSATGLVLAVFPAETFQGMAAETEKKTAGASVTASEDLMREHGVLRRIFLIWEEGLSRLQSGKDVPADVFHNSAALVRKFVEDYHEKLEEKSVFPDFESRRTLVDLVSVLRRQHAAGRILTDVILRNSQQRGLLREAVAAQALAGACRALTRMYRPHAAREDTVLFPALPKLLPVDRLRELGEQFEQQEDALFGEGGFGQTVQQVAAIEKKLDIYDLSQFTPPVSR